MRTQRFVEVPAPLEARVSDSVLSRLRDALLFGAEARDRLNQTVHDDQFKERAAVSVVDALRPRGITDIQMPASPMTVRRAIEAAGGAS